MQKYPRDYLVKRLLYKSNYRGCKETDLILGNFAKSNIENLTDEELLEFDKLLSIPDTLIWDWLHDRAEIPQDISKSLLLKIKTESNYD